jgi:hypothetical protein
MHEVFLSLTTQVNPYLIYQKKDSPDLTRKGLTRSEYLSIHKYLGGSGLNDSLSAVAKEDGPIYANSTAIMYDVYFYDGSGVCFHYDASNNTFGYDVNWNYPAISYATTGELCRIASSQESTQSTSLYFHKLFNVDAGFVEDTFKTIPQQGKFLIGSHVIDLVKDIDTQFYRYLILLYKVSRGIKHTFTDESRVMRMINELLSRGEEFIPLCNGYELYSAVLTGVSILNKFFRVECNGPYLHLIDTRQDDLIPIEARLNDMVINPFYQIKNRG